MFLLTLSLVVLVTSIAASSREEQRTGTVYMKNGVATFKSGMDKRATAFGELKTTLNSTGWDVLNIKAGYSDTKYSNRDIMYAAGYLEGYLTADLMALNYQNLYPTTRRRNGPKVMKALRKWYLENDKWVRDLCNQNGAQRDPFLRHLSYVLAQMDGLYDGFVANGGKPVDKFVVFFLNADGDNIELLQVLNEPMNWDKMTTEEFKMKSILNSRCSALVKVLPDYEDIFMGHSTWYTYSATLRIYKNYNFNVDDAATGSKRMSFSSYPGYLVSLDDFYVLGSKMVMLETTNTIYNRSLFDYITTKSVLSWQRVRVANMLARNGLEWAKAVSRYNSGTYNNQYMIIDLKRIHLKRSLDDGALTIVEQIPTLVEFSDQTSILREGYWPSYNVPFHEKIYNKSGYPWAARRQGIGNMYQLAPRAKIFRRDAGKVKNMEDFKSILRMNEYKTDPYSNGNSCDTICCRGDLLPHRASFGCYDTKVTDYKSALQLKALAISGPTLGHGQLPPFTWNNKYFKRFPHLGLPTTYDFNWVEMVPFN